MCKTCGCNKGADSITKESTNRMLTRKEMQRRLIVKTPYLKLLRGDMKILIPTLITIGLIVPSPVSIFLGESLGEAGYRLVVLAIAGYAAWKFGQAVGQWRAGYIMSYLEGFDLSTVEVSIF